MKIGAIVRHLEDLAPPSYQESYDNAGLIVGNNSWECTGVLLTLDSTEAVVDEAIAKGLNLIVAHHPIVFSGLKRFTGQNYVERTVIKAIKNDIAIYAIHTNLDNMHTGVSAKICEKLGLVNLRVLAPKTQLLHKLIFYVPVDAAEQVRKAVFKAGAGQIGNYENCSFNVDGTGTFKATEGANPTQGTIGSLEQPKETRIELVYPKHLKGRVIAAMKAAHPYEEVAHEIIAIENALQTVGSGMIGELPEEMPEMEFLKHTKSSMQTACVKYTRLLGKSVKKVAVCGGSGGFLLRDAIGSKADVFITSDYKYHEFFDANGRIVIADIGHFESEQFTAELLSAHLIEKLGNFAVAFSETRTNPVNYLT